MSRAIIIFLFLVLVVFCADDLTLHTPRNNCDPSRLEPRREPFMCS